MSRQGIEIHLDMLKDYRARTASGGQSQRQFSHEHDLDSAGDMNVWGDWDQVHDRAWEACSNFLHCIDLHVIINTQC